MRRLLRALTFYTLTAACARKEKPPEAQPPAHEKARALCLENVEKTLSEGEPKKLVRVEGSKVGDIRCKDASKGCFLVRMWGEWEVSMGIYAKFETMCLADGSSLFDAEVSFEKKDVVTVRGVK